VAVDDDGRVGFDGVCYFLFNILHIEIIPLGNK
jgi:hypothetical protein